MLQATQNSDSTRKQARYEFLHVAGNSKQQFDKKTGKIRVPSCCRQFETVIRQQNQQLKIYFGVQAN
jgi:hypothetical protein